MSGGRRYRTGYLTILVSVVEDLCLDSTELSFLATQAHGSGACSLHAELRYLSGIRLRMLMVALPPSNDPSHQHDGVTTWLRALCVC
jgi:hypothetical protein